MPVVVCLQKQALIVNYNLLVKSSQNLYIRFRPFVFSSYSCILDNINYFLFSAAKHSNLAAFSSSALSICCITPYDSIINNQNQSILSNQDRLRNNSVQALEICRLQELRWLSHNQYTIFRTVFQRPIQLLNSKTAAVLCQTDIDKRSRRLDGCTAFR